MNRTARAILSNNPDRQVRLIYGIMASATTVFIEGSTVAVTVPRLSSAGTLAADDHVALQKFGTDTLIIGRVGSGGVLGGGLAIVSGTKVVANETNTPLNTMSDVHDPNNWGAASGITPAAGWYHVTLQVDWESMATGDRIITQLRRGGSEFAQDDSQAGSTTPNRSISGVINVDGTGLIDGRVYQNSGSNRTAASRLSVHRL